MLSALSNLVRSRSDVPRVQSGTGPAARTARAVVAASVSDDERKPDRHRMTTHPPRDRRKV